MQIKRAEIKNYMCHKKIDLNFSNFTVLVGKNGAGKTSIIEALHRFFTDFAATGGGVSGGITDYLWYDRDIRHAISIQVDLTFNSDEYDKLLPSTSAEVLKSLKAQFPSDFYEVSAIRQIATPSTSWKTSHLRFGKITLVRDDKVVDLPEFSKALSSTIHGERFGLFFFTPQKIAGDRLVVDKEKKIAYRSTPNIDSLASAGSILTSSEGEGKNQQQWLTDKGITLMDRPPEPGEVPFLSQPITAEVLNTLITNLSNTIKGKFRFILAARDNKATTSGGRTPIVDQPTLDSMRALSLSTQRTDEIKWDKFRNWIVKFLGKDVEPNPTSLLIRDSDLRTPISYIGGGEQSLFGLLWNLVDTGSIVGIEEPEIHFHPDYLRKLFAFFKEYSSGGNQTIICTHSPLLVDKSIVSNNWVISRKEKESVALQLRELDDLKLVLSELGVVPSDIYLKDFVLFVEGGTEREAVLPIFAKKLGFPLSEHVAVISIGGDTKLKDYLRMWLNLLGYASLSYMVLLDSHSKDLVYDVAKDFNIDHKKFHVLSKHCIEDYYPNNLIIAALKDLFNISVKEEDLVEPKADSIKSQLEKHKKMRARWKIDLGEYIAEQMETTTIPVEIVEVFNSIKHQLGLIS